MSSEILNLAKAIVGLANQKLKNGCGGLPHLMVLQLVFFACKDKYTTETGKEFSEENEQAFILTIHKLMGVHTKAETKMPDQPFYAEKSFPKTYAIDPVTMEENAFNNAKMQHEKLLIALGMPYTPFSYD